MEIRKYKIKNEGAQIYGEEIMAVLLYKMSASHVDECEWNKREIQDHIVIPEIGEMIQGNSESGFTSFMNEDQNATIIFWLSLLERTALTSVHMDVSEGFNSKTGSSEYRKARVSKYLISVDALVSHLEFIGDKNFTRHQKRNIKLNFEDFITQVKEYKEVSVIKERRDSKNNLTTVSLKIQSNRYYQINEFLYDKTIYRSKNDFRFIKNSVAVFVTVMRAARKTFLGGVIDTERDPKIRMNKINLIARTDNVVDQTAFKGLSYKRIKSNVCFRYIGSIADSLGLNRKTVAHQIQFLSDCKILSYVVVREWNNSSERYFITDSFSESFLANYILQEYRSHSRYDIVEISSFYGRAYSLESSNKPSDQYEEVDIRSESFKKAREQFITLTTKQSN
ncbi:hypothetical protein [Enterococcus mundtii]|uniref:hypothetical protein n=1 Tax=Enterococcus mundtii TaxID=53346 RepID=UPI001A968853|nr:hypothetical protein [Enterococcus mundtii]MBO1087122.1 hypothetical protein [Enterococcus mundtii]